MPSTPDTVQHFFVAMQTGASAEEAMMALFADDAVYVEPFSGTPVTHEGKDAIRATMRRGWQYPMRDMTITVDRVEVSGETVTAAWTCRSPDLPGGAGRGTNRFTLRAGKIVRLETTVG